MIGINSDIAFDIIDRLQEFHAQEGVELPEEVTRQDNDWPQQILAAHGSNPIYRETAEAIRGLEPEQQSILVALMWLGRGDYDVQSWPDAVRDAREARNERTAEYLLGTPLVATYLEDGLSELGIPRDGIG
ncbi:MAG: DUF3775 domain-containing protein [Gammaproteobacteria bacterium]